MTNGKGYEGDRPQCWDCGDDPVENLKRMFVDVVQARRIRQGQDPALRPVFLKTHGIAYGHFETRRHLPAELKVGVFALDRLFTWVRFSSDTVPTTPDLKTTLGVGIKLFGVPRKKLLGDGNTHDFILQNFDVFFVDTARDFCEFTKAGVVYGDYQSYLDAHPKTNQILNEMQRVESSVLSTKYWSVLPYSFGKERFVKYKLEPELKPEGLPASSDPNYLALDLARRLRDQEARFRFMVQFGTDTMPLDQATVRWSEQESAPIHVATLVLPRQDIEARGQSAYGENLAYNPWHCLPEHAPVGSVSEARRVVYEASSVNRRNLNGVPVREPEGPRPTELAGTSDPCIVRAAIHPAIGIGRVGNSEKEFFWGPEVTEPGREAPGFYRDPTGALKRQAAKFRIYGLNAEGVAVSELTADNCEIRWTVHLANKKAGWYQFQLALDIPEAESAAPSLLRNASIGDRSKLIIDPGPRSISGRDIGGGRSYTFDTGRFMDQEVYLGEIRTDPEGRLVVLGGRGKSASYDGSRAVTFANNEGWHDDVSDGPVTAEVTFQGKKLAVEPAWVVVAPPNYAPMQKSVRTMWDLIRDVQIQAGTLTAPIRPSFQRDIRPILERLSQLQWVNAGFAAAFGWKTPNDLSTPYWLSRLSFNTPVDQELRETIANHFRVFERDSWSPTPWPWLYGDAMNIPPAQTPRQNATLTGTQLKMLQQWAAGDFNADYNPVYQPPQKIEEVPVPEQPAMLDQAALEFCLADAFHPGCEMTWPMRTAGMYAAPFRLLHAPEGWIEPQYGAALTSDVITLPSGPLLGGQLPGGITRWMAVPWQTDTASCRSGYLKTYDPYVPSFWPARVPNQVLTEENYEVVIDEERPLGERLAAFAARAAWIRPLGSKSYTDQINNLAKDISQMGIVEGRNGPKSGSNFPTVIQVEQLPPHTDRFLAAAVAAGENPEVADQIDLTGIEKVRRFPYGLLRRQ